MRFGELRSIGHNIADSLASGIGLMIGVYVIDIYEEARRTPGGCIEVDFLTGTAISGNPSWNLRRAISRYSEALPPLCLKHRCAVTAFRSLKACFWNDHVGRRFDVTVEDQRGRCVTDAFIGSPGAYIRELGADGRIRRKRAPVSYADDRAR